MSLQLHQREKEGIRILDLHGHLIEGAPEACLRAAIGALTGGGAVNVILNFAAVTEIDADGAGAVVFCDATVVSSGGALRLLNLSPLHVSLLALTKLDTISEVFTDEQAAVNSFFPDRAVQRYDVLEFVEDQEKDPPRDPAP
jgi:anti-sigma B factor antagonist